MNESQDTSGHAGGWLAVLCVLLVVGEPSIFAWRASTGLSRVLAYGTPALLLLAFRLAVVGLGVAAGVAVWSGRPHGIVLARTFFVLSLVGSILTIVTPYFPANRLPGTTRPLVALVLAYHVAWLSYLYRSRRVARVVHG